MLAYIISGIFLLSLTSYFVYTKVFKKPTKGPILQTQQAQVERYITVEELAENDGEKKPTIYIGVKGVVFDVTKSASANYKKGASYEWLAGKEASVALAKMSSDEKYFNAYDKIKLNKDELESLDGWVNYMKQRYPIVGYISVSKKEK